jgi:DNA-binding CsgD family transcriptional regulator
MSTAATLIRHLSRYDLATTLDLIDAARSAGTEEQFRRLMLLTAALIPIEKSHISVADLDESHAIMRTSHQININFPGDWLRLYRERGYLRVDPAARILFTSDAPLVWSQLRRYHRRPGDREFYGEAVGYGLEDGFSYGARFTRSQSASFFTCTGRGLTQHPRHLTIIRYLMPHLHMALSKAHLGLLKQQPCLTPREVDVLNWLKFGKSGGDIACQLGCSERVIKFHLSNAMRKLNASNRAQAVAVALSTGLIEWG